MSRNPDKVNLAFCDKAVQVFKALDITLPSFYEKAQFDRPLLTLVLLEPAEILTM